MSKHRVAVLKVAASQLSVTAAAAEYGISRGHLHRLLRRYREDGLEAVEPRSRRPCTSPGRTPDAVRDRIIALRVELTARGLDAGPVTIAWHLGREGLSAPSTSTIRRILYAAGLVTPEPRKRPRSSWIRFEAAMPNEPSSDRLITCVAYVATHVSPMSQLMTMARPTGVGRALATYDMPIEGRDGWIVAARRLA